MRYTELQVTSNFSFLRGGSHPEELVKQAVALGYSSIAITDRNTFAGIVRAHVEARKSGIRLIPGCRLDLMKGPALLAYPRSKEAYASLSALLTRGNMRAEKGKCHLHFEDVVEFRKGSQFIVIPPSSLNDLYELDPLFVADLRRYKAAFGDSLYLAVSRMYIGNDAKLLHRLHKLSQLEKVPVVATNDVHYHHPLRRELQDVVTCVREKCTIQNAGFKLCQNAERYLKPHEEMVRLFQQYPNAIEMTSVIAESCQFSLSELKYQYPSEVTGKGDPQDELTRLVWKGAHRIFGNDVPEKVTTAIHHELTFIGEMSYAEYFLTVYDLVRFARDRNILCQGRGSAANSTVCYCLGITSVDPSKFELLFERFLSAARNEPPDIDVDFEHERREEVIQYIYKKYGRHRAAIVATVTQQHHKGAIRDVGKAMGLSVDTINRLSSSMWEFSDEWFDSETIAKHGLNPNDQTLRKVLELTAQFIGFPRQLGQHTGGFVITEGQLSDLCPIINARMEDRTNIEWNKDDIEALGFLKIDVLGLGMLTCIRKAFTLAKDHYGLNLTLANIPQDDQAVYDMVSHADTIGVFQIESRAQQSMLPRLRPKCFYDLVIEVAIVRPGPIQGDMVHPYLRRRNGEEPVEYPSPELELILKRTLGVPLFQEQAMKIAIVGAGFTGAEADELRRSMATFKAKGMVSSFEEKLINGMLKNGYTEEYARKVFRQLEGFGSYGFPESHAVSFALLVYVSSWLKCYYPDVFACALLNSLPMGFYQPAQIVIDAQKHGVEVLPADVNLSNWDNALEEKKGKFCMLRLGFRQIKGMSEADAQLIESCRGQGFTTIQNLRANGISDATLELLADADAFRSIGLDRRQALWQVSVKEKPTPVFRAGENNSNDEHIHALPKMSLSEHVLHDYASTSLSLKAHPVSFVRGQLQSLGVVRSKDLSQMKDGDRVKVAGLVLVRQRPGTASGICFITIEDEAGCTNLVVFEKLFNQFRPEILQSSLLMVEGKLQIEGEVIHVIVSRCFNYSGLLRQMTRDGREDLNTAPLSRAEERSATSDVRSQSKPEFIQGKIFPEGRNFK
ncbi:error-prone DNA polymerase [Chryseolinea sp. T2]|uniref:error-prone DNA polymerase n=1 Tax=Chryseolinea sp. T2 TaxID=3129255 RepID=UPI003077CC3E